MKSVTASSVAGSSVKVTNKAWFVVQRFVLVRVGGSTVDHRQVVLPMEVDGEPSWFAKEMEYGAMNFHSEYGNMEFGWNC